MTAPVVPSTARNAPFGWSIHHVLRNQSDGRRCSVADSALRLVTVMRTWMSSGALFAYSTSTST